MNLTKKTSIFIFTSILAVFLTACQEKQEQKEIKKEVKKVKVDVHTLKKQTYPIWVNFSGKTQAYKNVAITSRVTGELEKRFFEAGEFVKKEQLLFKIDDTKYKNIVEQREATLQKDKASLNLAIANVKRYSPLVKKGLAPQEKLDQLIAEQKQLQAVVNADIAALKQAKLDVEYTQIKATIDGVIGKPLVDIGNMINASSTELAKVVQSNPLYTNFNPSTDEVSLIKKYKSEEKPKVEVIQSQNEYNTVKTTGHVDFIDNVTNETTGTVAMRAIINNDENLLLPGTFVEINLFITDKIPVIAVSPNNLGQNQLGAYVLVVNEENKIETRQLKLNYSNKDLVIISEGLQEGDKVIVSDITKLRNGMSVEATQVENPIKL
ncbi:efflux transporter periplasmic adaptor subunit [Malaciobacter halophilus]|uniref:Efflux transporter periplasmic adaptor subunit n=1 Tax=Malaciobacter halophilus TaxID=197482 RepID=A0A2N1J4T7_9BACT|nr:efflux RND transporter periplasmic adaptor subunit [Malaciobacter halophilus]AXH10170.1 RND family efflux system, membrane fusion protein [Malaciobacter halophilus]PKI81524.1 efflux transporter periplasmic adaptor subunit [Malaciobacter halophilus]